LVFGTSAFESYLDGQIENFRKMMQSTHARFVLLTVPCMHPLPTVPAARRAAQADPARVAWLNGVWKRYAGRHPGVVLADYGAFLCPDTAAARALAATWRPDGVTLGRAGAAATWKWLAPLAVGVARRPTTG
jgi:hypothetical protein